jgi:hypothetical protein
LVNELGDDLALAFLVDKKFAESCSPESAVALIAQIKGILAESQNHVPAARPAAAADKRETLPAF